MEQSTLSPMPARITTSSSKDTHIITEDSGSRLVTDEEMVRLEPATVVSNASLVAAG